MNEAMINSMNVVNELNKVEGFDPRVFLRNLAVEGESYRPYLDVVYRKLWFRLKNPEGKIVPKILQLTDQVAVFEAKVYLDRHDPEDCFIACATGQRFYKPEDPIGEKYVELAETAAIGRALQLAGYGLQFPGQTEDPAIVDSPMSTGQLTEVDPYMSGIQVNMQENWQVSNSFGNYAAISPAKQETYMGNVPSTGSVTPEDMTIDANLPVETIYSMLDRAKAEAVVCSFGINKGKTLGMLAVEKPDSLVWIRDKYSGRDNLIKAAAAFLLDTALKQAG